MNYVLRVVRAFGTYNVGDTITDPAVISAILVSSNGSSVVKVPTPAAVVATPTPAAVIGTDTLFTTRGGATRLVQISDLVGALNAVAPDAAYFPALFAGESIR